jgi:hypothetical protein
MPDEPETYARVLVKTQGLWRASQVADALTALDGLICRIATASALADYVQSQDYIINNLRVLGLLKKGGPDRWGKGSGGMAGVARTDYVSFVRDMRRHGVEVKRTPDTLKFSFVVSDLLEIVPVSSRLEIAEISMASPGKWVLTMAGLLAKKGLLEPVQKILDALLYYRPTFAKKEAEVRAIEATTKKTESEAGVLDSQADLVRAKAATERASAMLSYSKAIESVVASLRNAGFSPTDIKGMLAEPVRTAIATLSTQKATGLIEGVYLEVVELPDAARSRKLGSGEPDANL